MSDLQAGGFSRIPHALIIEHAERIGAAGIGVLVILASYANAEGVAWPSLNTLCKKTGLSRPTLIKVIKQLCESELLLCERQEDERLGHVSNRYTLCWLATPSKAILQGASKNETTLVNEVDYPSKTDLQALVKPVDYPSKAVLPKQEPENKNQLEQEPENKNTPPNPRWRGKARETEPEAFRVFYEAYPRKESRVKAAEAWRRLNPDGATVEAIMAGLKRARASPQWTKDGGAFIPHPSTWLNQRRWEDAGVVGMAKPMREQTLNDRKEVMRSWFEEG